MNILNILQNHSLIKASFRVCLLPFILWLWQLILNAPLTAYVIYSYKEIEPQWSLGFLQLPWETFCFVERYIFEQSFLTLCHYKWIALLCLVISLIVCAMWCVTGKEKWLMAILLVSISISSPIALLISNELCKVVLEWGYPI